LDFKLPSMKKILILLALTGCINVIAQPVYVDRVGFKMESIADIDIGWMRTYKYTTAPKGKTLGNRTYTTKQIGYTQQFVEWMQQSYLPKGCLGDAGYYQNAMPKISGTMGSYGNAVSQHLTALPHLYGAYSKVYMFLKKDAAGKFVPQNNFAEYWYIEANQIQYISAPVSFISSPDQYYFVMPYYYSGAEMGFGSHQSDYDLLGFSTHKNIQLYTRFYIPPKIINDNPHYIVIMTKNGKLPFENVSIGEFFERAELQLPVWQKVGNYTAENLATARQNLARMKEKYRTQLNEIATLRYPYGQISFIDFVNARPGNRDFFDTEEGVTKFPIQKVSKAAWEGCKTDQPQWIVIRWTLGMKNSAFNVHMMESILNNFNFSYVYNYFFGATKPTGPYQPLRSPSSNEPIVLEEPSSKAKAATADKSIFYFEDFSTNAIDKPAINWNGSLRNGKKAEVKQLAGNTNKWLELQGRDASPKNIQYPLPQNFELSFDVAAAKDIPWGAKALELYLGTKSTYDQMVSPAVKLRIKAGYWGRPGEISIEGKFAGGYFANVKPYFEATGFSNDKQLNTVKITLKRKGELLELFMDENKVVEIPKAIPATTSFNFLKFIHISSDSDLEKYYISNFKITKQ